MNMGEILNKGMYSTGMYFTVKRDFLVITFFGLSDQLNFCETSIVKCQFTFGIF